MAGTLITLEGIDGAGKTTLASGLRTALARRGLAPQLLREPGGVAAAEAIRALVRDPTLGIGPRAEALLFAAARSQLLEERLRPLLQAGELVLLDRFVDSSLVYQGVGRGLGIGPVAEVNAFATGGLSPDRTLLLDVDPDLAAGRARARDAGPDRIEAEDDAFFSRIARAYRELAAAEPARFRVIDAGGAPQEVLADALAALEDVPGIGRVAQAEPEPAPEDP